MSADVRRALSAHTGYEKNANQNAALDRAKQCSTTTTLTIATLNNSKKKFKFKSVRLLYAERFLVHLFLEKQKEYASFHDIEMARKSIRVINYESNYISRVRLTFRDKHR